MTREEREELIEAYQQNRLTDAQRRKVEQGLAEDTSFRKAVEEEKALWDALGPSRLNSFRAVVQEVITERRAGRPPILFRRYWPAVAAGMVVLLVGLWWLFRPGKSIEEELFITYFEAPAVLGISRDDSSAPESGGLAFLEWEIDSLYQKGNYRQALAKLESLPAPIGSSDYYYRKGLLLLLTRQPGYALEALQSVQSGYPYEKPWYIALAYLRLGDRRRAVAAFSVIARSADSPFREEAAVIAKALREE